MAASSVLSQKPIRALLVGLASAVLGVILILTGAMDGPERTLWDWRVRLLASPTDATDDVVLVLIDQESIELMSEQNAVDWPWPRQFYGLMIEFFGAAGAESVTIDLVLEDEGLGVFDNEELKRSAASFGRTVYGVQMSDPDLTAPEPWPGYVQRPPLVVGGVDENAQMIQDHGRATWPHPDLTAQNGILADVQQGNDDDGVFRRYKLIASHQGQPVPTLALAALAASLDEPLEVDLDGRFVRIGDVRVPVDSDGRFLLRYTTPEREDEETGEILNAYHTSVPAFDVVLAGYNVVLGGEPSLDPADFAGKHVMIGPSAAGLLDLRPTPLNPRAPGVTAHATALDNLLAGEFLRDLPVAVSIILVILLCVGAAYAATYAERTLTEILLIVLFVGGVAGLSIGGYLLTLWVPMVVPMIVVFLAIAAANVANYATEGAEKRFISGAFGTYVSPALVDQLIENPDRLSLTGERKELTMFFSDIQGFTTLSEGLRPEQLSEFLTHYLTELVTIIQDENGTIDKFEGDAIIAFWNAPLDVDEHAVRGVRAALACQKRLNALRPEYAKPIAGTPIEGAIPGVGRDIFTRMGLNTATVSVGNFGSESRFDYTALGDGMNLAARLEGANKQFGTYLMISENTKRALEGAFPTRELGRLQVVGRREPVTVFEPMLQEDFAARAEVIHDYEKGLQFWYNNRMDEAHKAFGKIAEVDRPASRMVDGCKQMLEQPADSRVAWSGVVSLTEK